MKVLIVKRDKIGDLLLTTPMLAHLKASRPQAELHLLANDYNAWVVADDPSIDRLWVYRRVRHAGRLSMGAALDWLRQRARLRRERFDWVIAANGADSPRALERALAVRGARTVAYCAASAGRRAPSDPLAVDDGAHEVDRLLAMLAPLGIAPPPAAPAPSYRLPRHDAQFARRWLSERSLVPGAYVVLGLGARRARKQPDVAQVLRWSEHWRRSHGLDTVFMWTPGAADDPLYPGDDATAQPVLDARVPQIKPFRGPLNEALGLVWSARTSVFPDSGLMHFAAASPGGVLGLFADREASPSPLQWAPRGLRADWLEAEKAVAELPDALVHERLARLLG